jgi:hypothetical protein
MVMNQNTKVEDIQTFLKQHAGIDVPYTTAHKAKESLLNESVGAQREQCFLILSYVEELVKVDSDTN